MEGKAVLFKKFAGIDVLRHRDRRARPGQAGRHHRRARADLRRHQPRGHQGAGVLLRRAQAARAHEDPGVPRRPARHRDHRRRGGAERPEAWSARTSTKVKLVVLGRGRRGARLPRPAGGAGPAAREHLGHRHQGRGLQGPQGGDGRRTRRATRRRPTARTLADVIGGADMFLGLSAGGVLKPEMVKKMAREAADPRARQPRAGDPARSWRKAARPDAIIATGRSDYPNQVNNVLCFPFIFRGALDVGRDDDQRGDEARRGARDRRARAGRAVRGRGRGLRRARTSASAPNT